MILSALAFGKNLRAPERGEPIPRKLELCPLNRLPICYTKPSTVISSSMLQDEQSFVLVAISTALIDFPVQSFTLSQLWQLLSFDSL